MGVLDTVIQLGLFGLIITLWVDFLKKYLDKRSTIKNITNRFKEEIGDNYKFIRNDEHLIPEDQEMMAGETVGYKIPRTGAWQSIMGSDELKYLDQTLWSKISMAYVKLFDFNNLLERLNSYIMLYPSKPIRDVILKKYHQVYNKLKEDTLEALKEAEKELDKY